MMNEPNLHFSIIIPTFNRFDLVAENLNLLLGIATQVAGLRFEVIVSDDGRDAKARQALANRFKSVKVIEGPGRGPAANRNHGAKAAVADWVVFLDDDCLPGDSFLLAYLDEMIKNRGESMLVLEGPTIRMEPLPSLLWECPQNVEGGGKISANFAIRRADLERVGWFDERYPSAAFEDTEFFNRFEKMGGKTRFVHGATVYHPLRKISSGKTLAKRWEGRVIYAFDQGASAFTVSWRLPWHVARVIMSRFRNQSVDGSAIQAASLFLVEWGYVIVYTWAWVAKWSKRPRSPFWSEYVRKHGSERKFGF